MRTPHVYKTPRPQPLTPLSQRLILKIQGLAWAVLAACDLTLDSRLPQNSLTISVHRSFWSILSLSPSLGAFHVAPFIPTPT